MLALSFYFGAGVFREFHALCWWSPHFEMKLVSYLGQNTEALLCTVRRAENDFTRSLRPVQTNATCCMQYHPTLLRAACCIVWTPCCTMLHEVWTKSNFMQQKTCNRVFKRCNMLRATMLDAVSCNMLRSFERALMLLSACLSITFSSLSFVLPVQSLEEEVELWVAFFSGIPTESFRCRLLPFCKTFIGSHLFHKSFPGKCWLSPLFLYELWPDLVYKTCLCLTGCRTQMGERVAYSPNSKSTQWLTTTHPWRWGGGQDWFRTRNFIWNRIPTRMCKRSFIG